MKRPTRTTPPPEPRTACPECRRTFVRSAIFSHMVNGHRWTRPAAHEYFLSLLFTKKEEV